jgi:hypothetical protein
MTTVDRMSGDEHPSGSLILARHVYKGLAHAGVDEDLVPAGIDKQHRPRDPDEAIQAKTVRTKQPGQFVRRRAVQYRGTVRRQHSIQNTDKLKVA